MTGKDWWQEPKCWDDKTEDHFKKKIVRTVEAAVRENRLPNETAALVAEHTARSIFDSQRREHEAKRQEIASNARRAEVEAGLVSKRIEQQRAEAQKNRDQSGNSPMEYFRKEQGGPAFDWGKVADAAREKFPDIKPTPDRTPDREPDR